MKAVMCECRRGCTTRRKWEEEYKGLPGYGCIAMSMSMLWEGVAVESSLRNKEKKGTGQGLT